MVVNPQKSRGQSLQPSSSPALENVPTTLSHSQKVTQPNEAGEYRKLAYDYEERINALLNENVRLLKENNLLKKKDMNLKENDNKKQNAGSPGDDDSINALKDEIAQKDQIIAELQATNKKLHEKIATLEKQQQKYDQNEKEVLEEIIAEKDRDDLLVIKKLIKCSDNATWHGYSNEKEEPLKLSITSGKMLIGDAFSQKKLILDGIISQFKDDPFQKNERCLYVSNRLMVSQFLSQVVSCNLNDLFLYQQDLTWPEYEKLISSSPMVQNVYFRDVEITKDRTLVPLENVLGKLPHIRKFALLSMCSVTNETFKNLIKLPPFSKLQVLRVDHINYDDFDAESFLKFMKKHANAHFTLSFLSRRYPTEVKALKRMLESRAAAPDKLEIKFQTF